jgi:hypothetical protein
VQVLRDFKADTLVDYNIDVELQKYKIPALFIEPMSYRNIMRLIGEACGGVTYQDRYGVIQVEASDYLVRECAISLETITEDKIYDITSPVAEVKNKIQVISYPYTIQASSKVWEKTGMTLGVGSNTVDIIYDDNAIVTSAAASIVSSPTGASILGETHYVWGATIVLNGTTSGQTATLTINGKPLLVAGTGLTEETDGGSIRQNGIKIMVIKDNKFIQSAETAELLAENVLAVYSNNKRDVSVNWRGDPSFELGDCITVESIDYNILSQQFNFNGILTCVMELRKA